MEEKLTSKQIKKIELDILLELTKFCDQHNIKYFLVYGTLLGAVRHKGFIPWDDDIDVAMMREDYERLNRLLTDNKIREDLEWISAENGTWNEPFGKLVNRNTLAFSYRAETSIWVDVFPFDNYDEHIFKKNVFMRCVHIAKNNNQFHFCKKDFAKYLLRFLFCWKSLDSIAQDIIKRSKNVPTNPNGLVANMTWEDANGTAIHKSMFESQTEVTFEGHKFKTFADAHKFLHDIYGDYMKLPPEDQRKTHGLKAWWIGNKKCPF